MKLDILIIDDKVQKIDALRQVIIPLFSDDRVLVDEAHTIAEAREIMREHTYDMAILDMVIPEHDGEAEYHDGPGAAEEEDTGGGGCRRG